jgi:hypothetical protein
MAKQSPQNPFVSKLTRLSYDGSEPGMPVLLPTDEEIEEIIEID